MQQAEKFDLEPRGWNLVVCVRCRIFVLYNKLSLDFSAHWIQLREGAHAIESINSLLIAYCIRF